MKIGIPRSFYFWLYPGLWETFFQGLGMEPVVSGRSTRRTLEAAVEQTESEHCLPHKLFDGHVQQLAGRVDALFVPRVLSMTAGHICCPRFGALPDATRAGVAGNCPVISIDINETAEPLEKTLIRLGRQLGASRRTAAAAARAALDEYRRREREDVLVQHAPRDARSFLLLGHPYTLRDAFIADPIIGRLTAMGVPVELMTFEEKNLPAGPILWCTFHRMHRRLTAIDLHRHAGVIQITTFNCGCDSMMTERFRRECAHRKVPYMLLMVDEHTGRAGIDTRIEAFVDSLTWKKKAAP